MQYVFRKSHGTCDALLNVSHVLQPVLERRIEARPVQIYFSAEFYRVHQLGLLYKLHSVGVVGSLFSVIEPQTLSGC